MVECPGLEPGQPKGRRFTVSSVSLTGYHSFVSGPQNRKPGLLSRVRASWWMPQSFDCGRGCYPLPGPCLRPFSQPYPNGPGFVMQATDSCDFPTERMDTTWPDDKSRPVICCIVFVLSIIVLLPIKLSRCGRRNRTSVAMGYEPTPPTNRLPAA